MPDQHRQNLSELASHAFDGWNTIPGMGEDGNIDAAQFQRWTDEAFRQAADVGRRKVADSHIGDLLARLARDRSWDDWLPAIALDLLDRPEHGGLREEFGGGVRNPRGITSRRPYDGGAQERKLAEHYRELAVRYRNSHPRVSALLEKLSNDYKQDATFHDNQSELSERWHR